MHIFHKWVYGRRRRMCRKCKKRQEAFFDGESTYWSDISTVCEDCGGTGEYLTNQFKVVTCNKCGGNGRAYEREANHA